MIERHDDMAQREAILRAQDAGDSDGPRPAWHWRRVAQIIAWRTGEDTITDVQWW
jgi:hypothetical protein